MFELGTASDGTLRSSTIGYAQIAWPGAQATLDGELPNRADGPVWFGSLIPGKSDASGMQYMRNRYYDPSTGRFTQEDPIGLAGGMNLYGFASGDPVNFSDPFGLCPMCIVVGLAALEGAVEGAILGGVEQMALNAIGGRPTFEGVARTAAIGAGVGAVTAGVGSAVRMVRALKSAGQAMENVGVRVASRAEAEAAGETFVGKNRVPMKNRKTGEVVGTRNPETGARYRPEKGEGHVNLENTKGGNTHVRFPEP